MLKLFPLASLLEDMVSRINKIQATKQESKKPELKEPHPGMIDVNRKKHMPAKSLGR